MSAISLSSGICADKHVPQDAGKRLKSSDKSTEDYIYFQPDMKLCADIRNAHTIQTAE